MMEIREHTAMYRDHETDLYPPSTLVHIALTNETAEYTFSEWVEQLPTEQAPNYRDLQREYGRCTGRVYVDTEHGVKAVGWFFISAQRYEDTNERYLRGAWVTLEEVPPLDFLPQTEREVHLAKTLQSVSG